MSEITGQGTEKSGSNLREALHVTFDPKYSTLGHGTWVETAKESIQTGVKAKVNHLGSTAIPLFDYSITYEEQIDGVIQTLLDWPHHHSPAVSIIMLPNPEKDERGGLDYFDSYFEELPEEDTEYNNKFALPASYVRGYIDAKDKVFIENPNFSPIKKALLTPVGPLNPHTNRVLHTPLEIPKSSQDVDKKSEDVW